MEIYESKVRMRELVSEKWRYLSEYEGIWRYLREYEELEYGKYDCVEL